MGLKDNRLCVAGDKSTLLIVGTSELRTARLTNQLAIEVDGQRVEETASEKLLVIILVFEQNMAKHCKSYT